MFHRDPSPFAPLPGTKPAPRGLFVHLWGTLAHAPASRPARTFQDVELARGAANALFRASQAGWLVYLLGNLPDVSSGRVAFEDWQELERALFAHLAEHGVRIERSYLCPDDPVNGARGRRKDSVYMLPNTGAFYHALHNDKVELRRSWVLGDSTEVLVAGWRAGLRMVGLRSGLGLEDRTFEVTPDFQAADLREAVLELLELENALHP